MEKTELRGCAGPPGRQYYYLLLITVVRVYCYTRVLLYAKMLKEAENEKTRLFYQIFVIVGILIKGPGQPGPPLAASMILK